MTVFTATNILLFYLVDGLCMWMFLVFWSNACYMIVADTCQEHIMIAFYALYNTNNSSY